MEYTLGIDLGGTKLQIGAVDTASTLLATRSVPTDVQGGPAKVLEQIVHLSKQLIDEQGGKPRAIGIGLPGQVDPAEGIVRFAPNLNWHNVSIRDELQKALGAPVFITNDVRAATWGEWQAGSGKGYSNIACIFVGTGVGGGLVLDGKIVDGANNTAAEVGHMVVQMNGLPCACGQNGCLEAYAGGWAIAKNGAKPTAKDVAIAYKQGDKQAINAIDQAVQALITASVNIINLLNPELLILGGGVLNGLPELIPLIQQGILKQAIPTATKVLPAALKASAGTIGAAIYASRH